MTGTTLAHIHWRALDRDGEDKCRLARHEGGFMLLGHARFRDGTGWATLDYVIRTGPDWRTRSADVTGTHAGQDLALRLTCDKGQWTLNGVPQPHLHGCEDVDFAFTPATNLMPLRRLPEVGRIATRAAWLRLPGPSLDPLDQTYLRDRGGLVSYHAWQTDFRTQLAVAASGFVTLYPGLWTAEDG